MKKMIVVYDGDCGICEKSRLLLEKLDWFDRFQCRPSQDQSLYLEFSTLKPEKCEREIKLISSSEKIYGGGDAVLKICQKLPLLFLIGWILWPWPLRKAVNFVYLKLAKNRYKISTKCQLKKPF